MTAASAAAAPICTMSMAADPSSLHATRTSSSAASTSKLELTLAGKSLLLSSQPSFSKRIDFLLPQPPPSQYRRSSLPSPIGSPRVPSIHPPSWTILPELVTDASGHLSPSISMSPTALVDDNAVASQDHLLANGSHADSLHYTHDSLGKYSSYSPRPASLHSPNAIVPPGQPDLTHPERSQTFGSEYDLNPSEAGGPLNASLLPAEGRRVRRKRKPAPPELLVIVRPPPSSKDRNPLNLQIQLIVPQAPTPSRTSGELSRDPSTSLSSSASTGGVARRASITSTRSGKSEATTASSSAGSNVGGSVKRVTPLYNLAFHSILPTTISDAGTDERVAKYSRKGVDIDGFGTLEPCELIPGINDLATLAHGGPISPSTDSLKDQPTSDPGVEPTRSQTEPPTSFESMTPEARSPDSGFGAKFARRFKGLSLNGPKIGGATASSGAASATGVEPSISSVAGSTAISNFFSGIGSAAKAARAEGSKRPMSAIGVAPSVFGQQSRAATTVAAVSATSTGIDVGQMIAGAGLDDSGNRRTQGYFWTIKKLNRKGAGGAEGRTHEMYLNAVGQNAVLTNVWNRFNSANRLGGDEKHPHPAEIPMRIEWTRDRRMNSISGPRSEGHSRNGDAVSDAASKRASISSAGVSSGTGSGVNGADKTMSDSGLVPAATTSSGARLRPPSGRRRSSGRSTSRSRSAGGARSGSISVRDSIDAQEAAGGEDGAGPQDDGYESDPEDSETPWSCHLVLGPSTRIPIGTLSPAPHHPKVVAQLAVPFPLPDLSQTGLGADAAGLTREEIKDIICVTCLHLIIRESFGGLGKVKRRGDRA